MRIFRFKPRKIWTHVKLNPDYYFKSFISIKAGIVSLQTPKMPFQLYFLGDTTDVPTQNSFFSIRLIQWWNVFILYPIFTIATSYRFLYDPFPYISNIICYNKYYDRLVLSLRFFSSILDLIPICCIYSYFTSILSLLLSLRLSSTIIVKGIIPSNLHLLTTFFRLFYGTLLLVKNCNITYWIVSYYCYG